MDTFRIKISHVLWHSNWQISVYLCGHLQGRCHTSCKEGKKRGGTGKPDKGVQVRGTISVLNNMGDLECHELLRALPFASHRLKMKSVNFSSSSLISCVTSDGTNWHTLFPVPFPSLPTTIWAVIGIKVIIWLKTTLFHWGYAPSPWFSNLIYPHCHKKKCTCVKRVGKRSHRIFTGHHLSGVSDNVLRC